MGTLSSRPSHPVKLTLNVDRNEIVILFPCEFTSDKGTKIRDYRFLISLNSGFRLMFTDQGESYRDLILSLSTPPPFSKQLEEENGLSHDSESRRWTEDDMWLRQTDLALTKEQIFSIRQQPISLSGSGVSHVNLGRWTSYRLRLAKTPEMLQEFRLFKRACLDKNVHIQELTAVNNIPQTPSMWEELQKWETPGNTLSNFERQVCARTLPYTVRYQLDVCVSIGLLSEYSMDQKFFDRLSSLSEKDASLVLENLIASDMSYSDASTIFDSLKLLKPRKPLKIPTNCILMQSATVTATTLRVHPRNVEISNRIIRQYQHYADHFLRIHFEDDEYRGNSRIYATTSSKMSEPFVRIKRALLKGINVGGRHFEFLAWGNSQLREHGAFFFAPVTGGINASRIVAAAGEFNHETIIAKRAARLGQCFSTTTTISGRIDRVTRHDLIDDIERNGYNFSDGCGKISPLLAAQVAMQLKIPGDVPSVFQFRLGGCKGVLAVAPDLKGRSLEVRRSQYKFPSNSEALEVIRHSEYWSAYLNRQLILVLSALEIPDKTFLDMQQNEINALRNAMDDDTAAVEALYDRVDPNRATLVLADMVQDGFRRCQEPFVMSLLYLWRAWSLKYLKDKAHIRVSGGALLLGCIDETAALKGYSKRQPARDASSEEMANFLPEVFIQVTEPKTGSKKVITGRCVVARNPSLHKGDIRVCMAVDKPQLRHLCDVVVLPQTGDRDISSCCSGGDLDGDDYVVSWDERLIPAAKNWFVEPFHYTPPKPVRTIKEVTQNDFIQFFHQYMKNDFLGTIATAHLVWADDEGIESEQCLELVGLHSMAVDYPKSGVPAKMRTGLVPLERPHFMERKGGKTYHSRKILGRLYDKVEKVKFVPQYDNAFDDRILKARVTDNKLLRLAAELKESYDESLRRIMAQHEIQTEFEVWSTFCLGHSRQHKDFKFHEELGRMSRTLCESSFETIVEELGGRDHETLAPFAVAAYRLTETQLKEAKAVADAEDKEYSPANMPFISFPWIFYGTLCKIARESPVVIDGGWQPTTHPDLQASQAESEMENGAVNGTTFDPWMMQDWGQHTDPLVQTSASVGDEAEDLLVAASLHNGNLSDVHSTVNSSWKSAASQLTTSEAASGVKTPSEDVALSTVADPASKMTLGTEDLKDSGWTDEGGIY